MKIKLDDIQREGLNLQLYWNRDHLKPFMTPNDPYEIEFVEPLFVDLLFEKHSGCVHVKGRVKGKLFTNCHRCLDSFVYPLDLSVETFLYGSENLETVSDEEVELTREDLAEEYIQGDEIDVDLIVAEEIFLHLPQVLLCSENCKGLCPRCGANLNKDACSCAKVFDSPFGALLDLKVSLRSR